MSKLLKQSIATFMGSLVLSLASFNTSPDYFEVDPNYSISKYVSLYF